MDRPTAARQSARDARRRRHEVSVLSERAPISKSARAAASASATPGERGRVAARDRLEQREVRSYESSTCCQLMHLDFITARARS